MGYNLDSIKKRIGIESLSEAERKRLFNKFVRIGGQVLEDKEPGKSLQFDRDKQRDLLKKLKAKNKALKKFEDWEEYEKAAEYDEHIEQLKELSFKDRLSIYLRGLSNGVITFSGKYVSRRFFIFIIKQVIPYLQRLSQLIKDIFNSDEAVLREIKKVFYSKEKYYYELLHRYSKFYIEEEFNSLLYHFKKKGTKGIKPRALEESLKVIFKKIYLLKDFVAGSYISLKAALTITSSRKGLDQELATRRIDTVKKTLNIIFFQFLPKVYSLALCILRENIPLHSRRFERYLDIKENEKVGYASYKDMFEEEESKKKIKLVKVDKTEVEYKPKSFSELTEEDMANLEINELLKYGIQLMQSIDFTGIKESDGNAIPLEAQDDNDKVYLSYLLLKEFEKEYSFILTSYKIHIHPEYVDNKKIDYKQNLNALYPKLTPIYEDYQEYFSSVRDIKDIKKDYAMNEIERYNRLNVLDAKKTKHGFEARKDTKEFLGSIKEYLDKFINDYNNDKKLIENPEEPLHFDKNVEGVKKVEDRSVIDAIIDADAYITAFIFRLDEEGDLSGISNEVKKIQIPQPGPAEEELKQESFLDELAQVMDTEGKK